MYCINFLREKKSFPDRPTVISVTGGTRNKELVLDGLIIIWSCQVQGVVLFVLYDYLVWCSNQVWAPVWRHHFPALLRVPWRLLAKNPRCRQKIPDTCTKSLTAILMSGAALHQHLAFHVAIFCCVGTLFSDLKAHWSDCRSCNYAPKLLTHSQHEVHMQTALYHFAKLQTCPGGEYDECGRGWWHSVEALWDYCLSEESLSVTSLTP